jgi:hypothetical protein
MAGGSSDLAPSRRPASAGGPVLLGWSLAALIALGAAALAQNGPDLPAAPGRDDVVAWCSGCHSMALVVQQGMSRARWDDTITWMVETHKMPEPAAEERKVLLDYLSEHYGEDREGGCVETPWGRRCR